MRNFKKIGEESNTLPEKLKDREENDLQKSLRNSVLGFSSPAPNSKSKVPYVLP